MNLTIHRGTHEIGGNCLEIATPNSRLILDVGLPLFDEHRQPHDTNALRRLSPDELETHGILPSVPGLFRAGPRIDGILLSHAHQDHTGLISHSRPEIPIYASVGTSKMMLAGSMFAMQPGLPRDRHRRLRSNQSVTIGEFTVTPFSVNHSIHGEQAFLIEAEGKRVLYSGDLRLHGRSPEMHRALVAAVRGRTIDVLLMEGTHIGHPNHRGVTEHDLEAEIEAHIRNATGLVLAVFSPQHVDRLAGLLGATQRAGRTFVADAYAAFVMHLVAPETALPKPTSQGWGKVFLPKFFEESSKRKRLEKVFSAIEPVRILMQEIQADPAKYVMVFRPSMLTSDFGGVLPRSACCLHSRWAGYQQSPDWNPVAAAIDAADGAVIQAHTSGHIYADDIASLIQEIRPQLVIPIHTFEPERFREIAPNVCVLEDGQTLDL